MSLHFGHNAAIRYRGFLLLPEINRTWLVRPERSPMNYLPFRIRQSSAEEVKKRVDMLLLDSEMKNLKQVA